MGILSRTRQMQELNFGKRSMLTGVEMRADSWSKRIFNSIR